MADEVRYQDESPRASVSSAELCRAAVWTAATASCNYQSQSWQAYNNTNPQRRAMNKACIQIRSLISKVHAHTHTEVHIYKQMIHDEEVQSHSGHIFDLRHACMYLYQITATHTYTQIDIRHEGLWEGSVHAENVDCAVLRTCMCECVLKTNPHHSKLILV